MNIDVFNGDADGICALMQFRLAYPSVSKLVTGVKRDIDLLSRVSAASGDHVVVLDVSLDVNRSALFALLSRDVSVFYMDHHYPGDIPVHPRLQTHIDTGANVCTSLLMNAYLGNRYAAWAVTGAFGDNLEDAALSLALSIQLSAEEIRQLKQLGTCLNYNAYGSSVADLYYDPEMLYRSLEGCESPFDFMAEKREICQQLSLGYADDMRQAEQTTAEYLTTHSALFILPDEKWARRVVGVWGNEQANRYPDRAHAIVSPNQQGGYQVSIRAPLNNKTGANVLAAKFSGGGRQAAAGVNHLAREQLPHFVQAFQTQFK